ncbi:hypothetical protein Hanom_Chr01g00087041 [Helianthus anomalus]
MTLRERNLCKNAVAISSRFSRGLHLCGRTRLGYLSGTETPWVLVGDVS